MGRRWRALVTLALVAAGGSLSGCAPSPEGDGARPAATPTVSNPADAAQLMLPLPGVDERVGEPEITTQSCVVLSHNFAIQAILESTGGKPMAADPAQAVRDAYPRHDQLAQNIISNGRADAQTQRTLLAAMASHPDQETAVGTANTEARDLSFARCQAIGKAWAARAGQTPEPSKTFAQDSAPVTTPVAHSGVLDAIADPEFANDPCVRSFEAVLLEVARGALTPEAAGGRGPDPLSGGRVFAAATEGLPEQLDAGATPEQAAHIAAGYLNSYCSEHPDSRAL